MASAADFFNRMPDPAELTADQLALWLDAIRAELDRLDQVEPANMESEAYENWAGRHEILEDLADDFLELLEERRA